MHAGLTTVPARPGVYNGSSEILSAISHSAVPSYATADGRVGLGAVIHVKRSSIDEDETLSVGM